MLLQFSIVIPDNRVLFLLICTLVLQNSDFPTKIHICNGEYIIKKHDWDFSEDCVSEKYFSFKNTTHSEWSYILYLRKEKLLKLRNTFIFCLYQSTLF